MKYINLRRLSALTRTDLVIESCDGVLTPLFHSLGDSPLMCSPALRESLRDGAAGSDVPFVIRDGFGVYFAAVASESGILYIGPLYFFLLPTGKQQEFLRYYGANAESARTAHSSTLPEMHDLILLAASLFCRKSFSDCELPLLGRHTELSEQDSRTDQSDFVIREETQDDDKAYRHSYHEEQQLMQAIRTGDADTAVIVAESMDSDSGRLSKQSIRHWKNVAVIGLSLCARAAIEGGLPPSYAYRVSGYYIQKCDAQTDEARVRQYRNDGLRELAGQVSSHLNRKNSSVYTERCKDYIRKHFREKIYLDNIAEALGISPGYLSKLFHRETGTRIQDYVTEIRIDRASNLLLYSELSLAEIAEYVNFPSQSYFGQAFRKHKGCTPRHFRELNQSKEYWEK